jgi:hypothetical protein
MRHLKGSRCSATHLTTSFSTMSSEADQTSNVTGDNPVADTEIVVGAESEAPSSTSFSTMADQAMARKEIPPLYEYCKELTVTEKEGARLAPQGQARGVSLHRRVYSLPNLPDQPQGEISL